MRPRIIPVIDLKNGIVVRGVGGRRDEYKPIVSQLTSSTEPAAVARALIDAAGAKELYVADLDAIAGAPPAWKIYRELQALNAELWVDAGVREADDVVKLASAGIQGIVCGLETLSGPAALRATIAKLGPQRVIFSLDLQAGRLLGHSEAWTVDARGVFPLLHQFFASGVRRLIVLDLAHVGEGKGLMAIDLCREIVATFPEFEVFAGGGLRDEKEMARLQSTGIAGILTASALHSGRLSAPKTRPQ